MKFETEPVDKIKEDPKNEAEPREQLMDTMQSIEGIWDKTTLLFQEVGLKLDHPEWVMVLQGHFDRVKHFSNEIWGTAFLKGEADAVITFMNPFMDCFNHVMEDVLVKAHNAGSSVGNDQEFKNLIGEIQENKSNILEKINAFKKIAIKL